MGIETERKFLLKNDSWRKCAVQRHFLCQAYAHFQHSTGHSFRIRIADEKAFLTLKSPARGISRNEFEYPIPLADAKSMLTDFCEPGRIEKYRYIVPFGGHIWEIDEFLGDNSGLVVAEIELNSEDAAFEHPSWLGKEVTEDVRYYNWHLLAEPFSQWTEKNK